MTVYVTRKWRIVQVSDGLGFPVWQHDRWWQYGSRAEALEKMISLMQEGRGEEAYCLIPIYVRWRVGDAGVGVEADFAGESLAEHYGSWEGLQ